MEASVEVQVNRIIGFPFIWENLQVSSCSENWNEDPLSRTAQPRVGTQNGANNAQIKLCIEDLGLKMNITTVYELVSSDAVPT